MKLFLGANSKLQSAFPQGCALSIGNFDGVHLGHQEVLHKLTTKAQALQIPAVVMLFEPHPEEYFCHTQGSEIPARIMELREKLTALEQEGITEVIRIPFTKHFSLFQPSEFVENILLACLGVKYLSVGDDFHFGANRKGDFELLQSMGAKHNFSVEQNSTFYLNNQRVSSTAIRNLLLEDNLAQASKLLGRDFFIQGRVVRGMQLGRTIGSPTANIAIKRRVSPVRGVYAVTAHLPDGRQFPAVANIGTRPSINGKNMLLEVHLLDFNEDLYGKLLHIDFHHKIRPEQKFNGLEELKSQIQQDLQATREFFTYQN